MTISTIDFPFLMALLAFVVICLLSIGIMVYLKGMGYRREMIKKLNTGNHEWTEIEVDENSLTSFGKSDNAFMNFLSTIGVRTRSKSSASDTDIKLKFLRAGLRGKNASTMFWGIKFLLAVVLPMAFLVLNIAYFENVTPSAVLIWAIFLALLGLILPDLWLRIRTNKRKDRIVKGFPDALDLLVVCVEAGMGLDAAIHRIGEELDLNHKELSQEFKLLNLELRAGKSRQAALRNLAERTDVDDVTSLVTLLLQTDRFGTSVAQALRVYSESFRTARFQRAEEIAAKIGTKLIFPLVLFIFPSFFVVAIGPAIIQIYRVLIVQGL